MAKLQVVKKGSKKDWEAEALEQERLDDERAERHPVPAVRQLHAIAAGIDDAIYGGLQNDLSAELIELLTDASRNVFMVRDAIMDMGQ